MNPSSPDAFIQTIVPPRVADLAFVYDRPREFHVVELPPEQPRFEDANYFMPLHVSMAGYGAVLITVSARPAYEDGSVEDWVRHHAGRLMGEVQSVREGRVGELRGMVAEAVQESEAGRMRSRAFFFEDGGRLVVVGAMAPEAVWGSVEGMLQHAISTFRLAMARGQTTPLTRAELTGEAPADVDAAQTTADEAPPQGTGDDPEEAPARAIDLALARDAASLDEDHPMNARLRDNGVGLVPRVHGVNEAEGYATLGAGAISATFNVPLGWHVIDDGRRTLVFDAAGKVQVNLNLRRAEDGPQALLDGLLAEHTAEQPELEHLMVDLRGMPCLAMRNYRVDDEILEQAFLVKTVAREGVVLVTRVTAASEDMVRAVDLAEVVLRDLKYFG